MLWRISWQDLLSYLVLWKKIDSSWGKFLESNRKCQRSVKESAWSKLLGLRGKVNIPWWPWHVDSQRFSWHKEVWKRTIVQGYLCHILSTSPAALNRWLMGNVFLSVMSFKYSKSVRQHFPKSLTDTFHVDSLFANKTTRRKPKRPFEEVETSKVVCPGAGVGVRLADGL